MFTHRHRSLALLAFPAAGVGACAAVDSAAPPCGVKKDGQTKKKE